MFNALLVYRAASVLFLAVSPFRQLARITVDGPDLILIPQAAQALSLLIHELTTNAVKYGSSTLDWREKFGLRLLLLVILGMQTAP